MSDVFLGVIAAAVLVMAAVQVAALVVAARTARRLDRFTDRFEEDIRPVMVSLQALTADAARATSVAAVQVERVDRLFHDLALRLDHTLAAVQENLAGPAREGSAWLNGFKAVLAVFRELRADARARASGADDEDALFIG